MKLLIVGCGYVGNAVAKCLIRSENSSVPSSVHALTRSEQSADHLRSQGIIPIVGHWLDKDSLPAEDHRFTHLLVGVPHRVDSVAGLDEQSDQFHVLGLRNLQSWLSNNSISTDGPAGALPKLIYLSTTGVYGKTDAGEKVDESTPVEPDRIGPRIAVAAERWLQSNRTHWPSTVLRLAGIYGPGRIPMLEKLRNKEPLAVSKDGRLNLIHLDDIAVAILWLMRAESPDDLYLLSDQSPIYRYQFYNYLAELHGLEPPQFIEPSADDHRVRRSSDKIVDSTKFWNHSKLNPIHADFRSGLAACFS